MKNFYFAATIERDGRYLAMTIRVGTANNVVPIFEGLKFANVCESKKQAEQIVQLWNASYRTNGTYLYND